MLGLGPGSGLDLFARVIMDALQAKLGTNFVIDYRVGAAGNIVVEMVARSAPDGTVLAGAIAARRNLLGTFLPSGRYCRALRAQIGARVARIDNDGALPCLVGL